MKNKLMKLVAVAGLLAGFHAEAFQPVTVVVPFAAALASASNAVVYTNTSTAFTPWQGTFSRLVINVTETNLPTVTTNLVILGFNVTGNPKATNYTTAAPIQATFALSAYGGTNQTLTAYLNGTNWDAANLARLDLVSFVGTNAGTINWVELDALQ